MRFVENRGFLKASRQEIEVVNISGLEQRQSLRVPQLALLESMLVVLINLGELWFRASHSLCF